MLSLFDEDSKEYAAISNRLIVCRKLQGENIDKSKGNNVGKLPEWSKRIKDNTIHNNILTKIRPLWMNYLYRRRKIEYEKYKEMYDIYCYSKYGIGMESLLANECLLSYEQEKLVERYKRFCPVILGSKGIMQRISDYMLSRIKELKASVKNKDFDYFMYFDDSVGLNEDIREPLIHIMKLYNKLKKNLFFSPDSDKFEIIELIKNKCFELSSSLSELTNMSLDINYGAGYSQSFVWEIFPDGILNNMMSKDKYFEIPVEDSDGIILFSGKRFSMIRMKTE